MICNKIESLPLLEKLMMMRSTQFVGLIEIVQIFYLQDLMIALLRYGIEET